MEILSRISTVWVVAGIVALTGVRTGLSFAERRNEIRKPRFRVAGEVLESLIIAVVLVFLVVRPFLGQTYYIPSSSMSPTLVRDDRILVNKLAYRLGMPARNEVVVFRAPKRASGAENDLDETDFVKRIVGLPGDTVEIHGGVAYVNDQPEQADFHKEEVRYDMPPRTVPEGMLFVMGDNRNHSNDSHEWGPLPMDRVIGRAMCVFWPPGRAGRIR